MPQYTFSDLLKVVAYIVAAILFVARMEFGLSQITTRMDKQEVKIDRLSDTFVHKDVAEANAETINVKLDSLIMEMAQMREQMRERNGGK